MLPAYCSQKPPPKVAQVSSGGNITLNFGQLPRAQTIDFSDVLGMTSTAGKTSTVTLALSGAAARDVQRVGFWEGRQGVVSSGLTLPVGQTAEVAFQFDLGARTSLGAQSGTLTITAKLASGQSQQCALPFTLTVASPSPGDPPSPSGTPTVSPSPSPSPSRTPTVSPSPSPTPSHTPTASPTPSPSPDVAPAASPTASATPTPTTGTSGGILTSLVSFAEWCAEGRRLARLGEDMVTTE